MFAALNLTLLLNTFYLQHTRGWTPLTAGIATFPMAFGATVCAPLIVAACDVFLFAAARAARSAT